MAIISNIIARLRADTAAFDRNMNKSRKQTSSFTKGVQIMGRQMLAIAGVGGGFYAIQRGFNAIIKAASDAEETQAKFDTVFRGISEQANKWAENFGEKVGRANQSVKSWMARLQDTFVPLGIAREEAMRLSQSLVTLAVDVASFNNKADADVIRDFTSALVGNHETVRKYGIIISETALRQAALREGLEKTYSELTDLEKVQLRYKLILEGTSDAQGDAMRTADSYANQVKRLTGEYENLKVEVGEKVIPILTKVINLLNEAIERHNKYKDMPWFGQPELGPSITEKWRQQQIEQSQLIKEAEKFAEIDKNRIKESVKAWQEYYHKRGTFEEQAKAAKEVDAEADRLRTEMWLKQEEAAFHAMREPIIEAEKAAQESAERHKRIAEDIALSMATSWSNAIDRMMFEGKEFWDAMSDMARSLVREIANIIMYRKIAEPVAYGIMGLPLPGASATPTTPGAMPGQSIAPSGTPYWPAGSLQYGGTVEKTGLAVVHKGETFSGVGGERSIVVNVNNDDRTLGPIEVTRAESYMLSDQRIIDLSIQAAQTNARYRKSHRIG